VRLRAGILIAVLSIVATACGGGHDEHGGSDAAGAGAGAPADATESERTIDVSTLDTLRFDPDSIEVKVGETVTFAVTNEGDLEHEFFIGEHDDSMDMDHQEGVVILEGGDSGEVTWTFTEAGELGFACYIDGHNASGMEGTITISE
jgi:uncharacterized cupredoxin-like copper-binding protein